MVYDSFMQWVEASVLPMRQAHPVRTRLDGWENGKSNVKVVAQFRHGGRVWEVHGDTRIAPTLSAYEGIRDRREAEPFLVEKANKRQCLNLKPSLRVHSRYKYFYVYESPTKALPRAA